MAKQTACKIYKYPLGLYDQQVVAMPSMANIIKVAVQNEVICLWAIVDPLDDLVLNRKFWIVGTGHDMPKAAKLNYLDSVLTQGGAFVWHVFEEEG